MPVNQRMRIAYFSPLNPRNTGISDYSEELLPALSELVDIDIYVDGYTPSNPSIRERFPIFDILEYPERRHERSYAVNLYHMGNSIHHAGIFRALMRWPGIVVLHDVILHHFFLEISEYYGNPSYYLREMAHAAGPRGIELGLSALRGEQPPPFFEYPLITRIANASLGLIVHNEYARQQVERQTDTTVATVPAHIIVPEPATLSDRLAARAELGITGDDVVFSAFGHATPSKRLDVALRSFARLHALLPRTRFVIVGEVNPPRWLDSIIDELSLRPHVKLTGPVSFEAFQRFIVASDVGVNLRYPTAGETSASLLRLMAGGLPVIVSDAGSFSELPDNCCYKIPVDSMEEDRLLSVMKTLAIDEELRLAVGQAARSIIMTTNIAERTARAYVDYIEQIVVTSDPRNRSSKSRQNEHLLMQSLADSTFFDSPEVALRESVLDVLRDLTLLREDTIQRSNFRDPRDI